MTLKQLKQFRRDIVRLKSDTENIISQLVADFKQNAAISILTEDAVSTLFTAKLNKSDSLTNNGFSEHNGKNYYVQELETKHVLKHYKTKAIDSVGERFLSDIESALGYDSDFIHIQINTADNEKSLKIFYRIDL